MIGLILVVSLSILFVGIDFLKGINVFKSSNLYYVAFKDVSGLAEAAPVTLNGMKVGQVTGMEYDYEHPGNVLVEVNLDSSVKLTKGTKFTKAVSLLGTGALAIEMAPGNSYVEAGSEMEGESQKDMMADISTEVLPQVVEMLPKLNSILAHVDSWLQSGITENSYASGCDIGQHRVAYGTFGGNIAENRPDGQQREWAD